MGTFDPAVSMFAGGASSFLQYWWIIAIFIVLAIGGVGAWYATQYKKKNGQWTHTLNVQIEQPDGTIADKVKVFKMRRWKHKTEMTAPLFEMDNPLTGSRIFVELEQYAGYTSYNVVLGNDGRLYVPKKTIMSKDKNALLVSVKHAGIDRTRQGYNNRFEQMNATPSKIDGLTMLKYGLYALVIICILIMSIVGLKSWGERASHEAEAARLELEIMDKMASAMVLMESVMNTQALVIPDLKKVYGNNLQAAIINQKNNLEQ